MNRNSSRFLMHRPDSNDCSIGRNNDINKNIINCNNNKHGCLKNQQHQATKQQQEQQHLQQSLTLVQQEHSQQSYPPHNSNNSNKNNNNHFVKKNNDFIDVTMTAYSISSYILNQKCPINGQKYFVAASSSNNSDFHTFGNKNKNSNNKNHQNNKNHTAPSMLLVSPCNPSFICEVPLLPVQIL